MRSCCAHYDFHRDEHQLDDIKYGLLLLIHFNFSQSVYGDCDDYDDYDGYDGYDDYGEITHQLLHAI